VSNYVKISEANPNNYASAHGGPVYHVKLGGDGNAQAYAALGKFVDQHTDRYHWGYTSNLLPILKYMRAHHVPALDPVELRTLVILIKAGVRIITSEPRTIRRRKP
jgi:hypothetical protein